MSLDAVHQTGEPDTPIEVITALLGKALSVSDAGDRESLLKQAHDIASGLDPYLDSISSPPDQVPLRAHQSYIPCRRQAVQSADGGRALCRYERSSQLAVWSTTGQSNTSRYTAGA